MLVVAGCTQAPPQQQRIPTDPALPALEWQTDLQGDAVEVVLIDRKSFYTVEKIVLNGPAGQAYEATEITRRIFDDDGYLSGTRVGVGGGSGGGGIRTGIGLSFPLGRTRSRDHVRTETTIFLPNAESYRNTVADWTIAVTLADKAGAKSTAVVPAPSN